MATNTIGIIGGGVSGLAAAYELRRNAIAKQQKLHIHLFEKQPIIGGNADTVVVHLGSWKNPQQNATDYHRWADLGVNDINLSAYQRIAKIMKEINYFDKDSPGLQPKMLPLENTETYFTWDSTVLLTDDSDLKHGVSDTSFSIASKDRGEFSKWTKIIYKAADNIVGEGETLNIKITVSEFFDAVISDPEKMLGEYAKKPVDWNDPELRQMLTEIRDNIFYARTSAMYFANDYGPENMCLAAPMCYYRMQENKGDESIKPDRRYFVGGSTRWLKALLDHLLEADNGNNLVTITFHANFPARVKVSSTDILIHHKNDALKRYVVDRCVITVHADDAIRLLDFDYSTTTKSHATEQLRKQQTTLLKILQSVNYTRSTAVCHTYSGILPSNRNQWRTYNVLIRKGCSLKPYSMTYLCNRHQNDAAEAQSKKYNYNQAGLPQFFVSLNPQREIPEQFILTCVDSAEVADELLAELPQLSDTVNGKTHYGRIAPGKPAITHFKHNLIDQNCFNAQRELVSYHQTENRLFFGGCWSLGSGLHEECWHQGERVAQQICPV